MDCRTVHIAEVVPCESWKAPPVIYGEAKGKVTDPSHALVKGGCGMMGCGCLIPVVVFLVLFLLLLLAAALGG